MLDFLLRSGLTTSIPWLAQIIIIVVVLYAIIRVIVDAREKKYEDRLQQKNETISDLKTERDVQMAGMQQQIEGLRINVKELEKKLEREFARRQDAEKRIMELEKTRQINDSERMSLLSENRELFRENRDLRISFDNYKETHSNHHGD